VGGIAAAARELKVQALEKEKAFAFAGLRLCHLRYVRQGIAMEGGERIFNEQGTSGFFAQLLRDGIVGEPQLQRTPSGVVRIAGNEMNQAASQPVPGILFCPRPKHPRQRSRGDLREAAA